MDRPTGAGLSSPRKHPSARESLVDAFLEENEDDDGYADAGADDNGDDDEEYLPAAKRRSRKKLKTALGAASSSSRTSARTVRKGVYVSASKLLKDHKGNIQPAEALHPQCNKGEDSPKFRIVLREKFTWKLYPEVSFGIPLVMGD